MVDRRSYGRAGRRSWLLVLAAAPSMLLAGCADSTWEPEEAAAEARKRLSGSEGGRRVLEAIRAHGGLEAWYAAPTSAYAWEYSNEAANLRFESYLVADNRSRQVYHELRTWGTPDSVGPVDARFAWDGEEAWISPAERRQPNPRFWALTGYYFESIPFVMADPGVKLELLTPEELEGTPHDRVMAYFEQGVGDTPGDIYVLYIHPESDMVNAVLYTVTYGQPYEPTGGGPQAPSDGTLLYYEDYVTVDGLTVATRFRGYEYRDGEQGAPSSDAWAREISFREPFDSSLVEAPEDARIEPYSVE